MTAQGQGDVSSSDEKLFLCNQLFLAIFPHAAFQLTLLALSSVHRSKQAGKFFFGDDGWVGVREMIQFDGCS